MSTAAASPSAAARPIVSIAIIGGLFFIMGWFTWLNGPLISFVQLAFDLDVVNAFLVTFVAYLSYFVWALPASAILDRTGMKKGMAIGLWVMAVGAVAFGQFCTQRWYPGALGGLFVIFAGLAILQTASNPYISVLGPIESGAQRIAVMGICNKIAGILAPIVLGTVVLHGMGDIATQVAAADAAGKERLLNEFAASIHTPYLLMAGVLALLGVAILFSPLPDVRAERGANAGADDGKSLFQFPHVWLGALAIFVYVGAEVMAGDAIGTYGSGFNIPVDQTKFFTSFTLGGMLLGYIVGFVTIPRFISQQRYLAISAILGVAFTLGAYFTTGYLSVGFVAALGFANAMMWPAIFPLAIHGLGRLIERGSALLIMGIAGGAVIPQLFAMLKQHLHFQLVFLLLMVPCYLYILYYARRGHRVGLPKD
ncbi:sugar MFS transporter [Luteimonas panaciterrae]|uniref:sugar MFS transporter n=1 Tax=Luteimonas panaciterrae TaxID=363885 RepID=UPI001CFAD82C|nr:sugar MFS transporter [Luteimonas panaciterrae]